MSVRNTALLYASELEVGETKPFPCPACGATHEDKFYVTKDYGVILYQCKRASCGASSTGGSATSGSYAATAA